MASQFTDTDDFCGACGATIRRLVNKKPVWCQIYRLVIVDRAEEGSPDEKFWISGIGADGGWAPLDRPGTIPIPIRYDRVSQEARNLGCRENIIEEDLELISRATWWSAENINTYPHGYPIHDACWTLIYRYIDIDADKQLERLVITLRKRWYSGEYGFEKLLPMEPLYKPWIPAAVISTIGARYHFWVFQADPVNIPAVKKLIKKSTRPTLRKDCQRNQNKQPVQSLRVTAGVTLPPEIHYMILDLLDYQDVENCLETLGWSVSDIYWCQRIANSGLLWEHENIPAASIDRKYLCLGMEHHIATAATLAMESRQRIQKILSDAKIIYGELDSSTRLRDFVYETYEPFTGLVEFDLNKCTERFNLVVETLPIWEKYLLTAVAHPWSLLVQPVRQLRFLRFAAAVTRRSLFLPCRWVSWTGCVAYTEHGGRLLRIWSKGAWYIIHLRSVDTGNKKKKSRSTVRDVFHKCGHADIKKY